MIVGIHNMGDVPEQFREKLEPIAEAAEEQGLIIKDITISEHD